MQPDEQTSYVRGCSGSMKSSRLRVKPTVTSLRRWGPKLDFRPRAPPSCFESRSRAGQLSGLGVVLMMSLIRWFRNAMFVRANRLWRLLRFTSTRAVTVSTGA